MSEHNPERKTPRGSSERAGRRVRRIGTAVGIGALVLMIAAGYDRIQESAGAMRPLPNPNAQTIPGQEMSTPTPFDITRGLLGCEPIIEGSVDGYYREINRVLERSGALFTETDIEVFEPEVYEATGNLWSERTTLEAKTNEVLANNGIRDTATICLYRRTF